MGFDVLIPLVTGRMFSSNAALKTTHRTTPRNQAAGRTLSELLNQLPGILTYCLHQRQRNGQQKPPSKMWRTRTRADRLPPRKRRKRSQKGSLPPLLRIKKDMASSSLCRLLLRRLLLRLRNPQIPPHRNNLDPRTVGLRRRRRKRRNPHRVDRKQNPEPA